MSLNEIPRRAFLKTSAAASFGWTARSYGRILGANDRLVFATIGLSGRGYAHLSSLKANRADARLAHVCDVDAVTMGKFAATAQQTLGEAPATHRDFREVLALREVDVVSIATPDFWHTPMAIDALKAGKHVYVEKPCSHNPAEGVMLVAAQRKYGKLAQMGNQQRSSPHTIEIVEKIHGGLIGEAYAAESWYVNTRKSIGHGEPAPVPAQLDWELWQGPVPRRPYTTNIQPYNWHWFRAYGTGETLNNGTHEVDVCRWALGVEYPDRVANTGGRYAFQDDWQFPDTQTTSFVYAGKSIAWEGYSCSGMKMYGRDRGSVIRGTKGSAVIDRDGYDVFDLGGKKTGEFRVGTTTSSKDLIGADSMTDAHFANLIAGIKTGARLNAPVAEGNVAVTMLQLANIAWEVGRELQVDAAAGGRINNDAEARKLWTREYEPGWAPAV